jgi:flagellar biosynthesis protein FlhG
VTSESSTLAKVIAIGGGKGGTGSTLLANGLAVFLAQLGKKTLYVDAHPQGPTAAATFGVARTDASLAPWSPFPYDPRGNECSVAGVRVLDAMREDGPVAEVSLRSPRKIAAASQAEFVLFDLGSGVRPRTLDVMCEADVIVLAVSPEPTSVEALWRLVRHLYARRVANALRLADDRDTCDELERIVQIGAGPPPPLRLATVLAARSPETSQIVYTELSKLRVRFVVNPSRSRADIELGDSLVRVALRLAGPVLEYLGHVEYDDAVFLAARRRRPLLVEAPATRASRNIERIARRLISLETTPHGSTNVTAAASAPVAPTHYDLLAIDRSATDEEIRRAYRKTREVYAAESVCLCGLMTPEEVSSIVARVEEARDVLLDASRRRPYDLSITPVVEMAMSTGFDDEPAVAESAAVLAPMPDLTPDTEVTGALLRSVREARGVDLRDVAARTKISLQYLRAIEDDHFAALPPAVYTRGFVVEYAKYLKLDVDQVVRTWFRRYRKSTDR